MRQQLLHGYVLHQRPYRENSHLVHFFSLELGRVDGVLRKQAPALYQSVLCYASGKTGLKQLTRLETVGKSTLLQGQGLFAGFYLNELLIRLLPVEEAYPFVFAQYVQALQDLQNLSKQPNPALQLLFILRQFEGILLKNLGYEVNFTKDAAGEPIEALAHYEFIAGQGFKYLSHADHQSRPGYAGYVLLSLQTDHVSYGQLFQSLNKSVQGPLVQTASPDTDLTAYPEHMEQTITPPAKTIKTPLTVTPIEVLNLLKRVYTQQLAVLLGEKPLKSRELWRATFTQ